MLYGESKSSQLSEGWARTVTRDGSLGRSHQPTYGLPQRSTKHLPVSKDMREGLAGR